MGCCKSSPNIATACLNEMNSISVNSSLTQDEMVQLETFLSEIPDHCRQLVSSLPERHLFSFYQYHNMAIYHGLQKEWSLAISYEHRVLRGLHTLLPKDRDHYIFFNFYSVLSASFLALGELEAAIEGIHITLAILLKHTPTDYYTISNHYYHLAGAYKVSCDWKATAHYLTVAIETARCMDDLDQEFISKLENELQMVKYVDYLEIVYFLHTSDRDLYV